MCDPSVCVGEVLLLGWACYNFLPVTVSEVVSVRLSQ